MNQLTLENLKSRNRKEKLITAAAVIQAGWEAKF
jgi:hypothetical protein